MAKISAKTWNRFLTNNFHVSANVMGAVHRFEFENRMVSVILPKAEYADRDRRYDEVATAKSRWSKTKEPIAYSLFKVDLEIDVPDSIDVPDEALTNPPKQFKHYSEAQKKIVDDICEQHSGIAERAFEYWLDVMRWISGNALIGQPIFEGFKSGWSTYLKDSQTNHDVWASTVVISIHGEKEVTKEHWEKAAKHLQNGDKIPMHLRFLHDAKTSVRNGQYEKAIIEIAMACEIYLRYEVFEFIPDNTPSEITKYIEEANINKYASQFFRALLTETQKSKYKKISKEISSLMSRRNSYMHMGKLDGVDARLCQRFIGAAEDLFTITLAKSKFEN